MKKQKRIDLNLGFSAEINASEIFEIYSNQFKKDQEKYFFTQDVLNENEKKINEMLIILKNELNKKGKRVNFLANQIADLKVYQYFLMSNENDFTQENLFNLSVKIEQELNNLI